MKGMNKAIKKIFKTIESGQKVFILGDSDADGISAAALLYEGINFFGGEVKAFIPNRQKNIRKIVYYFHNQILYNKNSSSPGLKRKIFFHLISFNIDEVFSPIHIKFVSIQRLSN